MSAECFKLTTLFTSCTSHFTVSTNSIHVFGDLIIEPVKGHGRSLKAHNLGIITSSS